MTTKIPAELSSTPGIVDGSNATAITIDSSENVGIGTTPATGVRLDIRNDSTTNIADLRNANSSGFGLYTAGGSSSSQYAFRAADKDNTALFTVKSDGNVDIADGDLSFASGHGIDFSATGNGSGSMSSELLDDYEEGYWTPSLPEGGTISTYAATYTKIGRQVIAYFYIVVTPTNNSQQFKIGNLPYTCINQSGYYPSGSLGYSSNLDLSALYPPLVMVNDTYAYFHFNNGNANFVTNATMQKSGGLPIIGQVIYDAA